MKQGEIINTDLQYIGQKLSLLYNHFMILKIFIDSQDPILHRKYEEAVYKHNQKIIEHPEFIDAGFDLFTPYQNEDNHSQNDKHIPLIKSLNNLSNPFTLDFKIVCSAKMITDVDTISQDEMSYNTGYDLRPRSSISNTPLRLANSIGTIDAGYRGHLMGKFDLLPTSFIPSNEKAKPGYLLETYTRLVQICAPGLLPILVKIVKSKEELGTTLRGEGGFGSTGQT